MFEQLFCGECGQMKDQCICLETGHIDELLDYNQNIDTTHVDMVELLFPMSDVLEVLTDEMFEECTHSEQIDAAELDGLPVREAYERDRQERESEREAEARMGGDNHYYPESYEEVEQRFVDSLPPAGVDPEWYWEYNQGEQ